MVEASGDGKRGRVRVDGVVRDVGWKKGRVTIGDDFHHHHETKDARTNVSKNGR